MAALRETVELNRRVQPAAAEAAFREAIKGLSPAEMTLFSADIEAALASFLTQRRRVLRAMVAEVRADGSAADGSAVESPAAARPDDGPTELVRRVDLVISLNRQVLPGKSEEEFRATLDALADERLPAAEGELRRGLESFLPKRRRALEGALAERLALARSKPVTVQAAEPEPTHDEKPEPETVPEPSGPPPTPRSVTPADLVRPGPTVFGRARRRVVNAELTNNKQQLSTDLEYLANHHIFQWATFYRETLSEYFDAFLEVLETSDRPKEWLNRMKAALSHHASDIFTRGYAYQTDRKSVV